MNKFCQYVQLFILTTVKNVLKMTWAASGGRSIFFYSREMTSYSFLFCNVYDFFGNFSINLSKRSKSPVASTVLSLMHFTRLVSRLAHESKRSSSMVRTASGFEHGPSVTLSSLKSRAVYKEDNQKWLDLQSNSIETRSLTHNFDNCPILR